MHRSNSIVVGLALLFAIAVGSPQAAFAQYLPGYYGSSGNWGAYPAMNAAAASRTVYAQKAASQRQSLAQVQQRHTAQNKFLMSQSRERQTSSAQNTRAASENWMRSNQPRQTYTAPRQTYTAPRPTASSVPAVVLPIPNLQPNQPEESSDTVVNWPSLLKERTFRMPRVRIEAIMTKAEPDGPGLSENDYKEMVLEINRMKSSLKRMAENLNAAEYIGVVNYLDKLAEKAKAAVKK